MSIKSCRFLWFRLQFEERSFIRIPFPISLYVFQELLDCFADLLTAASFLIPKASDYSSASRITINSLKELIIMVIRLLDSLTEDESYNLIDVTTGRIKVLIKIR